MNTNQPNGPGMELDEFLSTFFKAEMPNPFPAMNFSPTTARAELPMPAARPAAGKPSQGQSISRSRLALAASVALLLGGCWYLSGQIGKAPERSAVGKGDSSAKIPKEIGKANGDLKKASGNVP